MKHALIAGVTGIVGGHLAEHLLDVGGLDDLRLSRSPSRLNGVNRSSADLNDPVSLKSVFTDLRPSDVFITTWSRQATEVENIRVNGGMVRNLLKAVEGQGVKHTALVTGTKHHLGPFEAYAQSKPETPFREDQPRLPFDNFYYVQEGRGFRCGEAGWFHLSVHRPHTLIGYQ